jgi:hypothetical protein
MRENKKAIGSAECWRPYWKVHKTFIGKILIEGIFYASETNVLGHILSKRL